MAKYGVTCKYGCSGKIAARGLCWKHYRRVTRYGSPDIFFKLRAPLEERLEAYTDRNGPIPDYAPQLGPCWLWTGTKTRLGYGQISSGPHRTNYAHRLIYARATGSMPRLELDHLCRVPSCVNPAHLEPVTHRTNQLRSPLMEAERNKRFCVNGHDRTGRNEVHYSGRRFCRECLRTNNRRSAAKRRARQTALVVILPGRPAGAL
jgi:hypothetical protein